MKFDQLIQEQFARLDEAPGDPAQAPVEQPEDPNIDPEQSALPTPDEVSDQPEPLTPEGKVFLIDLVRKALAFDPQRIPEFDREVLGTPVTPDNAESVLKDIQRIVSTE